jgi:Ca-activated chloride channel family protein
MKSVTTALMLLLCAAGAAFSAGSLTARAPGSNREFVPLWIKSIDADVTITDDIAVTHIDQVFKNTSSELKEGIFEFELPDGAVITELALWIQGERVVAEVYRKDEAKTIFDAVVRMSVDPALLEQTGENMFKLSIFPIEPDGSPNSERRIEISYAQPLHFFNDTSEYIFPLKTTGLSEKAPERVSVSISGVSQFPVASVVSPSHGQSAQLVLHKDSDTAFSGVFGDENSYCDRDLIVHVVRNFADFTLEALTYTPDANTGMFFDTTGDDPYFLLSVTSPAWHPAQSQPREVVFIVDISHSMAGECLAQVKTSVGRMIDALAAADKFNVVAMSTTVGSFSDAMVQATSGNTGAAKQYIGGLSAKGITNAEGALIAAAKTSWTANMSRGIVFLTDGRPTWPVRTSVAGILDSVARYNTGGARIYPIGIGPDVDKRFLNLLAENHSGFSMFISSDADEGVDILSVMERLTRPLLTHIAIDFGTLQVHDLVPAQLSDFYYGGQGVVLGRFRGSSTAAIGFSAVADGQNVSAGRTISFPVNCCNPAALPPLWASKKIDGLLDRMAIEGEGPELVEEVTELGLKYRIVTPYTSFLALESTAPDVIEATETSHELAAFEGTPVIDMFSGDTVTSVWLRPHTEVFSNNLQLRYAVPISRSLVRVSLKIYDMRGILICTLTDHITTGGVFRCAWDGRDNAGNSVACASFIMVLQAGTARQIKIVRRVM